MKVKIEVDVPDSIDLEHTLESVLKLLYFTSSEDVSQEEYDLVNNLLDAVLTAKNQITTKN